MRDKVDIQQSLQQLKATADSTLLKGLTLTPETEKRILARIRSEGSETAASVVQPRRKYAWIILFCVIVTAGLGVATLVHAKSSAQRVVTALEMTAIVSSPAVAFGFGALAMKDALRPSAVRVNLKIVPTFAQ